MSNNSITQKEWISFLDLLHNKLRNAKGLKLTQMPALYEISNFMLFRFLDNKKIFGIELPKELNFRNMYEKYATDEKMNDDKKNPHAYQRNCYKLWDDVYNFKETPDINDDCLIARYISNEKLRPYFKSTINRISAYIGNDKAHVAIQEIVNMIYKKFENIEFDSKFFDMFGSAYEEFKTNACGNGGKQTAQHFTNVYIKKIIIDELRPCHDEIFYEPCAGSGGFIHTADHYVLENEGEEKSNIFKKNIFANECNPEIFRPLILNMLFHNIPVTEDALDNNIREEDSLCNNNIKRMRGKCDLIATNFPFGMSTTLEPDFVDVQNKYWDVLKNGKNYIKNSTAQFIIHIYHSLKQNGRTGFVSDRGILNNGSDNPKSWESKIRKFIFENTNLYKIVLLPQGAFTYTNFQTCMMFFKKGEKTQTCKIYEAKFKVPKDKTSEIYVENTPAKEFKYEDLVKNNFNLGLGSEIKEIETQKGFVKLGGIINNSNGGEVIDKQYFQGGNLILFTCSNNSFLTNYDKFPENKLTVEGDILLTRNGNPYVKLPPLNSLYTNVVQRIQIKKSYNYKFVYYYLHSYIKNIVIKNANSIPSYNMNIWENIQIPSLSLSHQQEIVELLDKLFKQHDIEQLTPYTKDAKLFDLLIDKKYDEFSDAIYIIYRKIDGDEMDKKFELDKKSIFNVMVNSVNSVEYRLGDIVETCGGIKFKLETQCSEKNTGNIYLRSQNLNDFKMRNNDFIYLQYENKQFKSYKINNGDLYYVLVGNVGVCGECSVDAFMSGNMCSIRNIKNICVKKYLMIYLIYNKPKSEGNAQPNISRTTLHNIIIKIPSIEDQQIIIQEIEKIELLQSSYANYTKMLSKQIDNTNIAIKNICNIKKQNIATEPITNSPQKIDTTESENDSDNDDENINDTLTITKPKQIIKKKIDTSSSDSDSSEEPKIVVKKVTPKSSKKIDTTSSDSDSSEEPKIVVKKVIPKSSKKYDTSSSDSDSSEESKKVIKKVIPKSSKKYDTSSDSDSDSSEEPKKVIKKVIPKSNTTDSNNNAPKKVTKK